MQQIQNHKSKKNIGTVRDGRIRYLIHLICHISEINV